MKIEVLPSPEITESTIQRLLDRSYESNREVETQVADIITTVVAKGDAALIDYSERFDRAKLTTLKVTPEEIQAAYDRIDPKLLKIIGEAYENIRIFHEKERQHSWREELRDGVILGQLFRPVARAGIYVPGGKAGYPSTVLMAVTPAQVAGVPSIVMTTPPKPDGSVDDVILATAKIAGVTEIYKVGGAQAIAALAYGTESIKRVQTIVGPGNIYVATAKKQVFGQVNIDMIAGPSEIGILSDGAVPADIVAADLLSQAEHDELAQSILVTTSFEEAEAVAAEVYRQIEASPRQAIMTRSIEDRGRILVVPSKEDALKAMNLIAPEHLEVLYEEPFSYLDRIENAGAIFLGPYTPEPIGDYYAGPNHTLPTSGTSTFSSPLGVQHFVKHSSIISYSKDALDRAADGVMAFAESEGLFGHAEAIRRRVT